MKEGTLRSGGQIKKVKKMIAPARSPLIMAHSKHLLIDALLDEGPKWEDKANHCIIPHKQLHDS